MIRYKPRGQYSGVMDEHKDGDFVLHMAAQAEIDSLHAECDRLTSLLQWEQNRRERIGTHGPDCWKWGPSHYECALRELNSKPKLLEAHDLTEPGWYWHKWPLQKEWRIVTVHHTGQAAGQFIGPLKQPEVSWETPEEKEHIAILRDLRHWVLFSADSDVDVPDFDKVADALKWAVAELEKGERDD